MGKSHISSRRKFTREFKVAAVKELEPAEASLLFQVICQRYEKQQPIVLTSNKAFADWSHVCLRSDHGRRRPRPSLASLNRDQHQRRQLSNEGKAPGWLTLYLTLYLTH